MNEFFFDKIEAVNVGENNGGGYESRTRDLLHAMQALSQLS